MARGRRYFLLLILPLALSACTGRTPDRLTLTPTAYNALPDWQGQDHAEALAVFRGSCDIIAQKAPEAKIGQGMLQARAALWQLPCAQAAQVAPGGERAFFETYFTPYSAGNNGVEEGLFTGYYEPLLQGARRPDARFNTPVYALPPECARGSCYPRAAIDAGALNGKRLEILWVDDPVALFIAQIQGTATVQLPDGSVTRIGYAGKNGQAYVALGKIMADEGLLVREEVTMFAIRDWLRTHPREAQAMMQRNPSYVFFKEVSAEGGPKGAQTVPLTAQRSLAVDSKFIPYGLPVYLQVALPPTAFADAQIFNRLVIAQDTGGAIKGPVRGDIFFGSGPEAESLAALMKNRGRYALLLPNGLDPR